MRALVFLCLLTVGACDRDKRVDQTPQAPPSLRSGIEFGDPRMAFQIERGLHQIEADAWRWTSGRFSVRLLPPPGAATKGARLKLSLAVPPPVIAELKGATLTCSINGVPMPPETWTTAGPYVLARDVAPIAGDLALLECWTANVIPPGPVDKRELGVIVTTVRLEPK